MQTHTAHYTADHKHTHTTHTHYTHSLCLYVSLSHTHTHTHTDTNTHRRYAQKHAAVSHRNTQPCQETKTKLYCGAETRSQLSQPGFLSFRLLFPPNPPPALNKSLFVTG